MNSTAGLAAIVLVMAGIIGAMVYAVDEPITEPPVFGGIVFPKVFKDVE